MHYPRLQKEGFLGLPWATQCKKDNCNFSSVSVNRSAHVKAPKKPKAIWEAKVPVEKENTVPEVNVFAVMEEVPEVHISVAEAVAYKGDREAVVSPGDYIQHARPSPGTSTTATAETPPRPATLLLAISAATLKAHFEHAMVRLCFPLPEILREPPFVTHHFSQNSLKTPTSFPPTQAILKYSLSIPCAFWIRMFYGIGITS